MKRKERPAPRHMVTSKPVATAHRCHRVVLSCLVRGEPTLMDPVHITLRAEAMALVMGLHTYEVGVLGRKPMRRNVGLIKAGLPEHGYIQPQHRCEMCWDHPVYVDPRRIFEQHHEGDEPPF